MSNYTVIKIVHFCKLLHAGLRTLEGDDLKDCLCVFSGKQKCPERAVGTAIKMVYLFPEHIQCLCFHRKPFWHRNNIYVEDRWFPLSYNGIVFLYMPSGCTKFLLKKQKEFFFFWGGYNFLMKPVNQELI